jgi:hypothetical protein
MGKYDAPVFDDDNVDNRFGPEPPEGWHRGTPGLRKRTPEEHREWLANGGQYSYLQYAPRWGAEDEDDYGTS